MMKNWSENGFKKKKTRKTTLTPFFWDLQKFIFETSFINVQPVSEIVRGINECLNIF